MRFLIFPLIPLIVDAASIVTSTPLNIPIKDVVNRNFSVYQEHPLMPTFKNWLKENEDLDFISGNATAPAKLDAIHCETTGCLFESSFALDSDTVKALDYHIVQESKRTLLPRVDAVNWVSNTHWKTYFYGQEGGAEHYTTWNLLCGRYTYRGTGFVISDHSIQVNKPNDIVTKIKAYEFRNTKHKVSLQQNFACAFFGNACCVNHKTVAAPSRLTRWTWECNSGTRASACQG